MGLSDTKADLLDQTLSIVWGRERWQRTQAQVSSQGY